MITVNDWPLLRKEVKPERNVPGPQYGGAGGSHGGAADGVEVRVHHATVAPEKIKTSLHVLPLMKIYLLTSGPH